MIANLIERVFGRYRQPLELLWRHSSEHRVLLGVYVLLTLVGVVTESVGVFLLVPLLESMGTTNMFSNIAVLGVVSRLFDGLPAESRLVWAGLIMLVVVVLRSALQFAQDYIGYAIPHRVDFRLRLRAFRALLQTSMLHVDSLGAGQVTNFSVSHPARIGIALRFAATLIANVLVLLSYIVVIAAIAPIVSLAAAVYFILSTLLFKSLVSGLVHRIGRETTEANERFSQLLYELLGGAKLIRLAGAVPKVTDSLAAALARLQFTRDRTVAVENMTVPFFSLVGGVLICVLVIFVGLLGNERAGQLVGVLVIFVLFLFRILAPLSIINISRNIISVNLDALTEYDRLMTEANRAREKDGDVPLREFREAVRFRGVSFAYAQRDGHVLSDVSLDIARGKVTAIVGPSGSGKSSIVNLMTRLYPANAGRITIDGRPIDQIQIETWWRQLAVVTQEVVILNDTIRANMEFGLGSPASDAEISQAARLAAIDTWIDELPDRYETVLGDRGGRLSGGQRQRIALARALLRRPEVIVLDEATSALDTLTEREIHRHIMALAGHKTIVLIAHRLSTVRQADQIVVIDKGRIVESGRHDELIARRGVYWNMVQSQSLDAAEGDDAAAAGRADVA